MSKTALAPEIRYGALWVTLRNAEADRSLICGLRRPRPVVSTLPNRRPWSSRFETRSPENGPWTTRASARSGFRGPGILVVRQKLPQLDAARRVARELPGRPAGLPSPARMTRPGSRSLSSGSTGSRPKWPRTRSRSCGTSLRRRAGRGCCSGSAGNDPPRERPLGAESPRRSASHALRRISRAPGVALRPYSVLASDRRSRTIEIARLLRRLEQGDPPAAAPERKGPSGFGRGFFEQPR